MGRDASDREDSERVRQDTRAGQNAYIAGANQAVINIGTSTGQAQEPGSARRRVWENVPARNRGFTGRKRQLTTLRKRLLAGEKTTVQALYGIGGVGKTQLVVEYAHQYAAEYDLVWWINAEQARLIGEQFTALADELGYAKPGTEPTAAQRAVLTALHERDQWLLVFDNAKEPEDVAAWLPGGNGHVLITSRTHGWDEIAVPVKVDVLTRAESVAILRRRVPALTEIDASKVAEALNDLPLAVTQAAGYMADTGIPAGEYIELLASRAAEIMDKGRPPSYPLSLAAVTRLAFERVRREDPAAAELSEICAFLAPELIPAGWFTRDPVLLPPSLADQAADPVAWRQVLARVGHSAVANIDHGGLRMHRLTQAILRSQLTAEAAGAIRTRAEAIVAASRPGDPGEPASWPGWARLLPHLLALDPAVTANKALRGLACDATWYLVRRGDLLNGHELASHLYETWLNRLGPDDTSTLSAANDFAQVLWDMGQYRQAQVLDEDTLSRRRRILGEDHIDTLHSANNLANDLHKLQEMEAARDLHEDTLARRRRVLRDNHPDTLKSANNLAADLRALGDPQAARELDQDTLARRRRVLGDDHPSTLNSANNLAADLRALGDPQAARELDQDTLARRRRVLGDDHPSTRDSASNLAADLRTLHEPC